MKELKIFTIISLILLASASYSQIDSLLVRQVNVQRMTADSLFKAKRYTEAINLYRELLKPIPSRCRNTITLWGLRTSMEVETLR